LEEAEIGLNMDEKTQKDVNKDGKHLGMHTGVAIALAASLIFLVLLALYFSKLMDRNAQTGSVLGYTMRSGEMTSRMRIHLLKSVELEKSAFMAITDEESKAFADQSLMNADSVERDYRELKGFVDAEGVGEEIKLLKEFDDCWKNFREIDKELLKLSVENTNIKAASLSFTKGAEAMERFEKALAEMMKIHTSVGKEARIAKLAYQAATAALSIYSLQAPHINEADDTKMDEIESVMRANEKRVRSAVNDLSSLIDKRDRVSLNSASSAFEELMKINSEVVRLSRINSNIKSLELSLGRKRKVAAQCEEALNSLQETVRSRTFKATK
jgi:hypothetical protein